VTRARALAQALRRGRAVRRLVYASTTGVYGDAGGAWVDETRACAPQTDRARRRVAAEQAWRAAGRAAGWAVSILRVPGIYAGDREGGPAARVRRGAPVLRPEDDVYTNHIHAEDLARACGLALFRGRPQRVYQVCDDSQRRMGEHFELVADACGLPGRRASAAPRPWPSSPVQMSFLSESRRLTNGRMKKSCDCSSSIRMSWTP
jgi:nucleoside-diphosphate-sugar epimerase